MRIEILDAQGGVENTINADQAHAEQYFPGAWRISAVQDDPATPLPEPRHLSVGAFFDRFGAAKWAVLADQSPQVQAVIKDASVRRYIDLDNPDLPAGLAIVLAAGHAIDPVAIVEAPVQLKEHP